MRSYLSNLWQDEAGVTTVEYSLLMALVVIASIGAWTALGRAVKTTMVQVNSSFANPLN